MAGFVTPGGERFAIFGEGGGQALADELDVPLLGKVPLTMPLREQADAGEPLVVTDPDDPAAQAIAPDRARAHRDVRRSSCRSCSGDVGGAGEAPASAPAGMSPADARLSG